MLSMNTNAGAALALRSLTATQTERSIAETRISTGLKVSSARDNGGVWGISMGLREDLVGLNAQQDSIARAESTLEVTLAALDSISDIMIEMRETALALSDSSLDAASFAALEEDYKALFNQTIQIVEAASFNGVNLLDGGTLSMDPNGLGAISGVNLDTLLTSGVSTTPAAVDNFSVSFGHSGDVTGNYSGVSNGNFTGDVWGDMSGVVNGSFNGDIYGDFSGVINNDFTGTVYGQNSGVINGANNGTFHNGSVAPPNPFTVAAEHAAFESYISGSFTGIDAPGAPASALAYASKAGSLDSMMEALGQYSASMGSSLKAATIQRTLLSAQSDVTERARGLMVDADLARESARLTALQTREQLAVQTLAIANAAPSALTRLFA